MSPVVPGQKGQLGPGTLGGNLVSGLTRDVSSCPGTEGTTWTWDFGGVTWSVD